MQNESERYNDERAQHLKRVAYLEKKIEEKYDKEKKRADEMERICVFQKLTGLPSDSIITKPKFVTVFNGRF